MQVAVLVVALTIILFVCIAIRFDRRREHPPSSASFPSQQAAKETSQKDRTEAVCSLSTREVLLHHANQ